MKNSRKQIRLRLTLSRAALAKTLHQTGNCGFDYGTWGEMEKSGWLCKCWEKADKILRRLARGRKGTKRRKTRKTAPGAKGGVGKGREGVGDVARAVSASGSTAVTCPHCHHSLENNSHGFDQNDARMKGDRLIHSGRCTYCQECNPRIREALEKVEEQKQLGSGWPCHTFLETPIYRKLGFSIDKRFYCLRIGKDGICFRDVFGKGEFLVGWAEIVSIKSN